MTVSSVGGRTRRRTSVLGAVEHFTEISCRAALFRFWVRSGDCLVALKFLRRKPIYLKNHFSAWQVRVMLRRSSILLFCP